MTAKVQTVDAIQYLGFDVNGEEVEVWLGDAFVSHLPSKNQVEMATPDGYLTASAGQYIVRDHGMLILCWPL